MEGVIEMLLNHKILEHRSEVNNMALKDEIKRLEATQRYLTFDVHREKELNEIVQLASMICEVPVALITLIDRDTQWIKAKVGSSLDQIPRESSFCSYAVETGEMMVVPDALIDPRFSKAPTVVNAPFFRFYASANLKSYDGFTVGTICVYDVKPKDLSVSQQQGLAALARQVSRIMELDHALQLLRKQKRALSEIARIQCHEIRKPVSSIMGVMQLIKDADYRPETEYLHLLERSVYQLDEKIRLVVEETAF